MRSTAGSLQCALGITGLVNVPSPLSAMCTPSPAGAEPADPRLAVPEHPPPPQPEPPAREPEPAIELGADGATATYPELAAQLAAELDIGDRSYRTRRYPRCFVGREAVDVLQRLYGVTSREAAVALGREAQKSLQWLQRQHHSTSSHMLIITH